MFFTILLLSYTIPAAYLFVRIWQLFIPGEHKRRFALVFIVLYLMYPGSRFFEGIAGQVLDEISKYLLPFFLYLFLSVLLTDIILLLNHILRIIPVSILKKRSVRNKTFILLISLSIVVVIAGIINFNSVRTSVYSIEIPPRSSDIDKLRIAFVSDFHLDVNTPIRFVEKVVKQIETLKPDLMLFGGDIVEGDREDNKLATFENTLRMIRTRFGVYGVLGNHEHYARQDNGDFFNSSGIMILRDTAIKVGNSFILAGRNDSHVTNRKSLDKLISTFPNDSLPVILLDHRPTEISVVSGTRIDLQLSGHTHNGQLFPINLITKMVYELSYGQRRIGNTNFIVSSGIRLWGPPVRTTGKSEIVVVDITFADK